MIGLRRRRNKQRVDAGGGKRDRAHEPCRSGSNYRDFGRKSGAHREPAITELHIGTTLKSP